MVLGNDLVPRLNFRSLCRLRNDVLDAISRARVNKMMIMQAIFKEFDAQDLMYPPGQEPDSPFKRSIGRFKDLIWKRLHEQSVELGLPGKIIHFAKVNKCKCSCSNLEILCVGHSLRLLFLSESVHVQQHRLRREGRSAGGVRGDPHEHHDGRRPPA